jgi:hypothetical protein
MPFEITNTLRGSSIVRAVDPGTYTITLNNLRANATTETVTAADIKHVCGQQTATFVSLETVYLC